MLSFGASFAAEMAKYSARPFWSVRLGFAAPRGDTYIAGRASSFGGLTHEAIISGLGDIASFFSRSDPTQLSINGGTLAFDNMAVLSTGERLSDLFGADLESLLADLYLNFELDDASIVQERLFGAAIQSPVQYGLVNGSLALQSLAQKYLDAPALRTISDADFTFVRESEIGKTVPIAISTVTRSPGRVVRSLVRAVSRPVAADTNTGGAQLLRAIANANAVSEIWTITVNAAATIEQTTRNSEIATGGRPTSQSFDAASHFADNTSSLTSTWSHTCSGSRRVLFVGYPEGGGGGAAEVSSVTYNGVALTRLPPETAGALMNIWALNDPPSGTHNIVVTHSIASTGRRGCAVSFNEAFSDSSIPCSRRGVQSGSGPYIVTLSPGLPVSTLDILVDLLRVSDQTSTDLSFTPGAGQTQRATDSISSGATRLYAAMSTTATANGGSTSWSISPIAGSPQLEVAAVSRRPVGYARSITIASTQSASAVQVWARRNPSASGTSGTLTAYLCADSGGAPGAVLGSGAASVTSTTGDYVTIGFPSAVTLAAGDVWLVVVGSTDAAGVGQILIGTKSSGTYYSVGSAETSFSVISSLTGDLVFKTSLVSTAFSASGSVTGADGTGATTADFTSDSGRITIPASAWFGSPAGSDVFTFTVDIGTPKVIFSESPADTPIRALSTTYWNDLPITGATISQSTDNESVSIGKATGQFGNSHAEQILIALPTLVKDLRVKASIVGSPTDPLSLTILEDNAGLPTGNVVASAEIDAADLTSTPTLTAVEFEPTVMLPAGLYWIVGDSSQADDSNYYKLQRSTTNAYVSGKHASWDTTAQKWVLVTNKDLVFALTAATLTSHLSTDDGTGNYVASIELDVDIPDDVEVTCDVDGITDDASGSFTGSPGATVTIPDHVIHWLLSRAGVPNASIDLAGSFAAAHLSYGNVYRFAGLAQDAVTYKTLLLQLAKESRSLFDWSIDRAQLKYLPDSTTAPTSSRTIEFLDIIADSSGEPRFQIERVPMSEIINQIDLRWARQARFTGDTAYARVKHARDDTSVGRFGALTRPDLFKMDFVASAAMATDLAAFNLDRYSSPEKRRISFSTALPFLDLEKGDVIGFDLTSGGANFPIDLTQAFNLLTPLDGLDGGGKFEVEAKTIHGADFSLEYVCREL